MATHPLLFSQTRKDGTATRALLPRIAQRGFLYRQGWLSMAQSAKGLRSLGHHLPLFSAVEAQRFVGEDSHSFAGTPTLGRETQVPAQRSHPRQPKREEFRNQRRAGLRRGQENQRTQAAYPGRHYRSAPQSSGLACQDRDGGKQLLSAFFRQKTRRKVKHIWADGAYMGNLLEHVRTVWRCTVQIVKRSDLHTFKVLPRRWVVERTFGWLGRSRRLTRDYERQAGTGETMVYLAMIRLMLVRLGKL